MIADCSACDPRNPKPGQLFADPHGKPIGAATSSATAPQVDYRNRDVSVESVLQVLTGHHPEGTPPSRRLDSSRNSNVLLYLTGHGGDGFLKFHDQNELLASDVASAISYMHSSGRYGQLMIMLDTCQAATMYSEVTAPGWVGISSSALGQSSYALHSDQAIGAHLIDEFSHHLTEFLQHHMPARGSTSTMESLLNFVRQHKMSSEIHVDSSRFGRPLANTLVSEFFGGSEIDEEAQQVPWKGKKNNDNSSNNESEMGTVVVTGDPPEDSPFHQVGGGQHGENSIPIPFKKKEQFELFSLSIAELHDTLLGAWPTR